MSNGNAHQSDWSADYHNGPARDVLTIPMEQAGPDGVHLDQSEFDGPAAPTPAQRATADQRWLERVTKALNL